MLHRQLLCSFIAGGIAAILLVRLHVILGGMPLDQTGHANTPSGLYMSTNSSDSSVSRATPPFADFPHLIWQTGSSSGIIKYSKQSDTWSKLNPAHTHRVLTDEAANKFVRANFKQHQSLLHFWDSLRTPVFGADMLRYLVMLSQGGVYSDIDTSCLEPIDTWIPPEYRLRTNAVIGIEYDDKTLKMFVRPLSFNQWTLMAKPGHPIFVRAVQRVQSNLEFLARQKRTSLERLELSMIETLEATGPGMISDVVLDTLRDQMGQEGAKLDWHTFHDMREPRLFGDVLVLPINGFAGHQKHSHAGDSVFGRKLVQHHFGRTWYTKKGDGKGAKKADAQLAGGNEDVKRFSVQQ